MINPDLEENEAETSNDIAGPSVSDAAGVSDETRQIDVEAHNLQDKLESHARAMQEIHKKLVLTKSTSTLLFLFICCTCFVYLLIISYIHLKQHIRFDFLQKKERKLSKFLVAHKLCPPESNIGQLQVKKRTFLFKNRTMLIQNQDNMNSKAGQINSMKGHNGQKQDMKNQKQDRQMQNLDMRECTPGQFSGNA